MGSRIKTTVAPVVFSARGEVLLLSKGSAGNRCEITKRVTEAESDAQQNLKQDKSRWDHQYKQQAVKSLLFFIFKPFSEFECLFFKNEHFGKFYELVIIFCQKILTIIFYVLQIKAI